MSKRIIVLGVNCLQQQATVEGGLPRHHVQFANSLNYALGVCRSADIIALHTDHEKSVPDFFKQGFNGRIIPLLFNKKTQGIKINGKFVEAVPVRQLADSINEL